MADQKTDAQILVCALQHMDTCDDAQHLLTNDEFARIGHDLLPRLERMLEEIKRDEKDRAAEKGIYRSKPRDLSTCSSHELSIAVSVEAADDAEVAMSDPKYAWVDVGEELLDRRVTTIESMEAAAKESYKAIRQRLVEANQRLAELENVEIILEENRRLKAELALAGPPEATEQLELMANKLGSANGQIKALELQVSALKQALSSERIANSAAQAASDRLLSAKVREELPALRAPALASEYDCVGCGGVISGTDIDAGWRKCKACRDRPFG